tara:strand:+ start:408 stop:827 length:420 start_codon:yes stop_codon:yes gene_type:complete
MLAEQINLYNIYMHSAVRSVSSSIGLSISQFYTIQSISNEGISMSELSMLLGLDNSTLTRNINQLLKRKLVTKTKSLIDKREYIISLSEKGSDVNIKIHELMSNLINNIFISIDIENKNILLSILEKINWKLHCKINDI